MFGLIYLRYGLLPSIILHFVFDVVWFALPLFATPALFDQTMVIILASAPLWLVLAKAMFIRKEAAVKTVHKLLSTRGSICPCFGSRRTGTSQFRVASMCEHRRRSEDQLRGEGAKATAEEDSI